MADEEESELRRRLAEAEDTIRAIGAGEVDALVVRGEGEAGEAVFSLVGGGESYRAFMESMDIGAAALDGEGALLYANAALCDLLCLAAGNLQEKGLLASLSEANARTVEGMIARAAGGRQSAQLTLECKGEERHVVVAAAPLSLPFGQGHAVTFTDVTDRVLAAAAAETERVGQAVMASTSSAVVVCDRHGVVTHANLAMRGLYEGNPVGKPFEAVLPFEFPVGAGFIEAADVIAVGLAGNSVKTVEASIPSAPKVKDMLVSVAPLRLSGGSVSGCAVVMIDMTERKAAEKRQSLLMNELDHRVKNMLTLVLSIASRTIAGAGDLIDFREKFTRRIEALAATHTMLSEGAWRGLTLEEVVDAELSPYVLARGPRVRLADLAVRVSPNTAVAFGLVIHELVTNAVKYGALSNEAGTIAVTGARTTDGLFELTWTEQGGPPVRTPERSGFGQTLIARSLGTAGGAGTQVEFRPEGVVCRIRIPASDLG